MAEYDLTNLTLTNKATGNKYMQDASKTSIYRKTQYDKVKIANFAITQIIWNDSSKDIDKVTFTEGTSNQEYNLSTNQTAFINRVIKDVKPSDNFTVLPSSLPKKYMNFAVNGYLYEFILLCIQRIQAGTIIRTPEKVTLSITSDDTEAFTNGLLIITAKDSENNAISGLSITGTAGETEISGTTDSNGQVTVTFESAGEYDVEVASAATTQYAAATKTGSVTVTAISQDNTETPGE